jgi:hydroxyacylglutathione hydrolase
MKLEQIYTGCIAHAAYYLESNGEAAIFDPLREVQPYIDRAQKDNAKIKYVFETHFHADFVSGHLDLAKKTGATIVYGPTAKPGFEAIVAEDNQIFKVGNYSVKVIHTPGHTLESTCYMIADENGKEHGIITGDTLFIGDVGRPDLAQHVIAELTQDKLASMLYDSLRNKIMPLDDNLIIYPNHGAGSACGKNMSKETTDTLGHQKQVNYALRADMTREEFMKELLEGLTTPPGYFPSNVLMNIRGYESLDTIMEKGMKAMNPNEFEAAANVTDAIVLDTRNAEDFAKGFVPRSINIGLTGDFAPWVGSLIVDVKQPLLLITEAGMEEETIIRLSRVGFDQVLGHLEGGFETWKVAGKEFDTVKQISADQFKNEFDPAKSIVFDVRKESEYKAEHVEEAFNKPLNLINQWMPEIDEKQHFYLHCAGGYRSMIAASLLKSRGYHNFTEVAGGFKSIVDAGVPVTDFVCQSKLQQA